eukprot:scaffold192706_cov47-Prasinocladus_malaysianus.AAC.2
MLALASHSHLPGTIVSPQSAGFRAGFLARKKVLVVLVLPRVGIPETRREWRQSIIRLNAADSVPWDEYVDYRVCIEGPTSAQKLPASSGALYVIDCNVATSSDFIPRGQSDNLAGTIIFYTTLVMPTIWPSSSIYLSAAT